MKNTAYVGLGSNLGDRMNYIQRALAGLAVLPGTVVTGVSAIYETVPWGVVDQPAYLNCVARLETELAPEALLRAMLALENELGRVRTTRWGPRTIDLDLLLYDDVVMNTELLTLPHPHLTERAFVLVPLADLAADLVIAGRSVAEHLKALAGTRPPGDVRRVAAAPKAPYSPPNAG